jgi:dihydropteroate synthase
MYFTESFQSMGVLNLTPDSFSDGGKLSSVDLVSQQIQKMRTDNCKLFDFGAESTAPFNKAVSFEDEMKRFEELLYPILNDLEPDEGLSIDTYKVEVMEKLMNSGKLDHKQVVFNDVSGALDSKLEDFLLRNPHITYVYSHNLAPDRKSTQHHMDYLCPYYGFELKKHLVEYFEEAKNWFEGKGIENTVWFDPCFGFSKDYQQNLDLISLIPSLIEDLGPGQTWLLGISKKSFLRQLSAPDLTREEQFKRSEQAHAAILTFWQHSVTLQNQIVIRLHDISLFQSVKRCKFLYES